MVTKKWTEKYHRRFSGYAIIDWRKFIINNIITGIFLIIGLAVFGSYTFSYGFEKGWDGALYYDGGDGSSCDLKCRIDIYDRVNMVSEMCKEKGYSGLTIINSDDGCPHYGNSINCVEDFYEE